MHNKLQAAMPHHSECSSSLADLDAAAKDTEATSTAPASTRPSHRAQAIAHGPSKHFLDHSNVRLPKGLFRGTLYTNLHDGNT